MHLNLLTQSESRSHSPAATATATEARHPRALIDELLSDQQDLTAVERFARQHEQGELPAQAKHYRDLIPLSTPKAGQQYAFDVDLDACTGCKACVTACHNLNGLDANEVFRDVGLLVGGTAELPILQHVTTACHHCLEPACLEGCPVKAYDKDPVTGIVKHLDDQCIGCQYCIFKCPYDVPKYNKRIGIVRKCDMCSDRLGAGEAPACVQACPNQAIRITIVDRTRVIEDNEANVFLPGAPEPEYTQPTTNYRTKRVMPRNLLPADHGAAHPQHAHPPLVAMLVLTQLSVGSFLVERIVRDLLAAPGATVSSAGQVYHSVAALVVGLLALGASTMHLGRPLYAFRAIIGLRTSWLSREIVAFGLFAGAASLYAACGFAFPSLLSPAMSSALSTSVIVFGLLGVFSSAMIYHDTRRDFWSFGQSGAKFLLSTLVLGIATTVLTMAMFVATSGQSELFTLAARPLLMAMAITGGIKLLIEVSVLRHLAEHKLTPQRKTARLLTGALVNAGAARLLLGLLGMVGLPLVLALDTTLPSTTAIAILFLLTLAGEFLERYLFFAAVVPPKMPGGASL